MREVKGPSGSARYLLGNNTGTNRPINCMQWSRLLSKVSDESWAQKMTLRSTTAV